MLKMSSTTHSDPTAAGRTKPILNSAQCHQKPTGTRTGHIRTAQRTKQRTATTQRVHCAQGLPANSSAHECGTYSTSSRVQKSDCLNHPHINVDGLPRYGDSKPGNDFAQGERIVTRSLTPSLRERERQAWHLEMAGRQRETERSVADDRKDSDQRKSSANYRTVLAKRGLLVKDTLGAGSYSKVKHACYVKYVDAKNPQLYPDDVAVKIIDKTIAPTDFQQKFLPRELEIWPQIRHEGIVHMLQWFAEGSRVYMILEYVQGGDALKFIQTSGAVTETTGKVWTRQVAEAVKYLHDLDLAHRDLKLENMLIDKHNNIKLCDFGFVKRCTDSDLSKTFCGSKSYAAPEILKGERYPPKKADIWAIGVILFILVTGSMPFHEPKGNIGLLEEQRNLALDWPGSRSRRAVSTHCKGVVLFCLKFLWSERPNVIQLLNQRWFHTSQMPDRPSNYRTRTQHLEAYTNETTAQLPNQ